MCSHTANLIVIKPSHTCMFGESRLSFSINAFSSKSVVVSHVQTPNKHFKAIPKSFPLLKK